MDHEEVEGLARAGERTASERLGGGGEGGSGLITRTGCTRAHPRGVPKGLGPFC